MSETTLIKNGIVITVDRNRRIFEDGAVVIQGDRIIDVGKTHQVLKKKYRVDRVIDARKKAVIPGLVNTHIHSDLIRGTADDMPLIEWLDYYISPWHWVVTPEIAHAAAMLTYAEALKSGTTCLADMFRYMHRCADAVKEIGIRAVLAPMAADSPVHKYESFEDNEKLVRSRNGYAQGRVKVWFGIEWAFYSSDDHINKVVDGAKKYHTGIHIHSSEVKDEWQLAMKRFGKHPIEAFADFGLLGKNTLIAHACWLTERERQLLGQTKTNIAHCAVSNQKLADGVCPVPELIKYGANVGLGTDGLKENNTADMFEVMKFASLLQKVTRLDATVLPAYQVLEMATIKGAKSLGWDKEIGSLEVGKKADLILVDLNKLRTTPVIFGEFFNVVSHLVYACHGDDVETVFVDGRMVMENHVLKNVDEQQIIDLATKITPGILERRKQFQPRKKVLPARKR